MVDDFLLHKIERRFRFYYNCRPVGTLLVREISSKMSQQNHSHIMVSFPNHRCLYYYVHISSIKVGREVVEDFSLRRIERRFQFFYNWRDINTVLVRSIVVKMSHQNHSNLMI